MDSAFSNSNRLVLPIFPDVNTLNATLLNDVLVVFLEKKNSRRCCSSRSPATSCASVAAKAVYAADVFIVCCQCISLAQPSS